MVDEQGQLYTIEGVAAGALIIFTAYLIFSSTFILTPGDTHINDMQLEQLGNDVLKIMDTRNSFDPVGGDIFAQKESDLETYISYYDPDKFKIDPLNPTPGFIQYFQMYSGDDPRLHLSAKVYYRDGNSVKSIPFLPPPPDNREHFVTVTRWVHIHPQNAAVWADPDPKTVLLEVLLWRE